MKHDIDELMKGAIDLHRHCYPEFSFDVKMRLDDLESAKQAASAGMAGFVLKSHMWPTVGRVYLLNELVTDLEIFPSITLNTVVGGFSPWATEAALKQGARIIFMPTWSSRNDFENNGPYNLFKNYLPSLKELKIEDTLTVFNKSGKIRNEVKEIISLAKTYDVAISTGHLSAKEGLELGRQAKLMGFKKIIFGHPDGKYINASIDQLKHMAGMGYFIEFTFLSMLPMLQRITPYEVKHRIRKIGIEHTILTTDAFSDTVPPPSEMMRMFIATLVDQGFNDREIEVMTKKNQNYLLNL